MSKLHRCSLSKFLLILAALALASPGPDSASAQTAAPNAAAPPPVVKFRPPASGAAAVRVTGGSRGSESDAVALDVLTPDDVGITTQEQPSLFWFQSKPADARFELTLLEDNKVKPVIQVQVDHAAKAGIQRLRLADHGAKLVPGVEYQWVIALIVDPDNRSKDVVASGVIKRIEPTVELKEKINKADAASLPGIYATAGIWYDALSALSDQVDAHPGSRAWRQTRADLLRQVGLKTAADAELAN